MRKSRATGASARRVLRSDALFSRSPAMRLIGMAGRTIWVTSVLERSSDAPMRLWAKGDVSIISMRGDVSLMAARCVNLDAGERTRLAAAEIDLHAGVARFVLDELVQVGRRASLMVGKIRYVGEMIETFAEHMLSRSRAAACSSRKATSFAPVILIIGQRARSRCVPRPCYMTADAVVRVDADQIHMG